MKPLCDICWKQLAPADVKTVRAASVVSATSRGYVPTKLPPTWKPECETLGITIATHWNTIVKTNSSEDWGLCLECLEEVEQFQPEAQTAEPNSRNSIKSTAMSDGEILVTASVYCASIMRMEGQATLLSLGREIRIFDIFALFHSMAKTLLTKEAIGLLHLEAARPSRIDHISRDDMLTVIADALAIVSQPTKL